jgi:phage baseplate assembly protein W
MGLFEQLREDVRASDAAAVLAGKVPRLGPDDRYTQPGSYAFTLHTGEGETVFPLVLNPMNLRKTHPFAVELTPTQESGVMAEENGVLISELTISGHTGVRPKESKLDGAPPIALSGQAHFLWLQDACFLEYSRLKKDPKTAAKTWMSFHNFKDSEHWVCVPRSLTLDRNQGKNFYYNYTIAVSLIEQIENQSKAPSEDNELFSAMKDAIRNIALAVATIQGVVTDIEKIESVISGTVTGVLANVTAMLGFVNAFVTGQSTFIRFPQRAMLTLATDIDTIMQLADPNKVLSLPYDYVSAFLEMQDGILRLAAYPEKFSEDFTSAGERLRQLTLGPAAFDAADLDAAAASSITQATQLEDSGLRPGDRARVDAGLFTLPVTFPRYLGFREISVAHGDSLPSIAARELGDARRWLDLAVANALKAPYISDEGLPFTLRPGAPILIPTTEANQAADTVRTAGDPEDGASQLDALFGSDFALAPQVDGTYDFVVDPGTLTDLVVVSGVSNIEQAINTILSTDRGSYLLHLNVGIARIIGRPGTVERVIEARARVIEAVQRDPRVAKVKNASFKLAGDALEIGLEVDTVDSSPIRVIGRVIS